MNNEMMKAEFDDAMGMTIQEVIQSIARVAWLGFEEDGFGQLIMKGECTVTLYQVGNEWEIDISLPNGSAIGCDVPLDALQGRTAAEIKESKCER